MDDDCAVIEFPRRCHVCGLATDARYHALCVDCARKCNRFIAAVVASHYDERRARMRVIDGGKKEGGG